MPAPHSLISSATYDDATKEAVITYSDETTETHILDGDTWRLIPYMEASTAGIAIILDEIKAYVLKYGNPYPTAHEA